MNTSHTDTQENNMSNLSGFEIRANLLNQAQGIIEGNISRAVEAICVHNDNNPNDKKSIPTYEVDALDVIKTARQLNEFVTEK